MLKGISFHRLLRGATKTFYRFIWGLIRLFVKKPQIEVLYNSPDDGSVIFCCYGPAYIEPDYGFIISEQGCVVEDSLAPNFAFEQQPFEIAVPSPFRFFKARKYERNLIKLDTAVSLRHFWEWNYYHFYFDVLGKIELLQAVGIDLSLPLVLAKYADDVPFVRPLIRRAKLKERQWISPVSQYVKADKIIFCRTRRPYKTRISFICDAVGANATTRVDDLRIFLSRSDTRRLSNLEEIKPVLTKYAFKIVDAAKMSVDEQICLFSGARYVIANHGAGTTNILFRGNGHLSLLELHHNNYMNYDHKRMCDELGYDWDHLEGHMGEGTPSHADFTMCPNQLEEKIVKMLLSDV